ncbi:hypothetical protein LDENG_00053540 [Lucifuga dentata]|nr:hypothetical protein LDENG_00053540 [Lucifuga dentata]
MHIQVLTLSQAYWISLELEMPESPTNQDLGLFMIRMTCFSKNGARASSSAEQQLSASSSLFSILRYRSNLLKVMGTLLFLPAFLTGVAEQKQVLEVELFSEYTDDSFAPSDSAIIEILSNKVQIYSSQLYIHAHFTGIRYLIFNFPISSALMGILSNFIFLSVVFVFSYISILFKVAWSPEQGGENMITPLNSKSEPLSERQISEEQQDVNDPAAGTAELLDPLQINPENLSQEEPACMRVTPGTAAAEDTQSE